MSPGGRVRIYRWNPTKNERRTTRGTGSEMSPREWSTNLQEATNEKRIRDGPDRWPTGKRKVTARPVSKKENPVSEKQKALEVASHAFVPENQFLQLVSGPEDGPAAVVSELLDPEGNEQSQHIQQFIQ